MCCQILDEADRLLDLDFGDVIDNILKVIPVERTTYLFSATMSSKVAKLQRASLSNPVRVEVSTKYAELSLNFWSMLISSPDTKLSRHYYSTMS